MRATPATFDPYLSIPPELRNNALISTPQFIAILNASRPVFFELMGAGALPSPARNTGRSKHHLWHIADVAAYLESLRPEPSTAEERSAARLAAIANVTPAQLKAQAARIAGRKAKAAKTAKANSTKS